MYLPFGGFILYYFVLFYVKFNRKGDLAIDSLWAEETVATSLSGYFTFQNELPRLELPTSDVEGEHSNHYTTQTTVGFRGIRNTKAWTKSRLDQC